MRKNFLKGRIREFRKKTQIGKVEKWCVNVGEKMNIVTGISFHIYNPGTVRNSIFIVGNIRIYALDG